MQCVTKRHKGLAINDCILHTAQALQNVTPLKLEKLELINQLQRST